MMSKVMAVSKILVSVIFDITDILYIIKVSFLCEFLLIIGNNFEMRYLYGRRLFS